MLPRIRNSLESVDKRTLSHKVSGQVLSRNIDIIKRRCLPKASVLPKGLDFGHAFYFGNIRNMGGEYAWIQGMDGPRKMEFIRNFRASLSSVNKMFWFLILVMLADGM